MSKVQTYEEMFEKVAMAIGEIETINSFSISEDMKLYFTTTKGNSTNIDLPVEDISNMSVEQITYILSRVAQMEEQQNVLSFPRLQVTVHSCYFSLN